MNDQLFATDAASSVRLPCISLWQPWIYWVGLGWKTVETRLHDRFRGLAGQRIGLHAALKWDRHAIEAAVGFLTADQVEQTRDFLRFGGHLACTAMVSEARWLTTADSAASLIECRSVRRFGLVLTDVRILPACEATYVKGRQGKFYVDLPADMLAEPVEGQVAHG